MNIEVNKIITLGNKEKYLVISHVVNNLKEGMTQYDAEKLLMDYGMFHGIQDFSFSPTCGFKTRGTFTPEQNFEFPRDSKLVKGTGIAFDVGYMDKGYCSDWGRTVYCGKAPELVKKGYEALQAAQCYMVERIKPGVTRFGDLYGYICFITPIGVQYPCTDSHPPAARVSILLSMCNFKTSSSHPTPV